MQTKRSARRSYGSGSIIARSGVYYGKWRIGQRQMMRKLGAVRSPGTRDGLTRMMAEAKLRQLMAEVATPPVAERVTVEEAGRSPPCARGGDGTQAIDAAVLPQPVRKPTRAAGRPAPDRTVHARAGRGARRRHSRVTDSQPRRSGTSSGCSTVSASSRSNAGGRPPTRAATPTGRALRRARTSATSIPTSSRLSSARPATATSAASTGRSSSPPR